MSRRIRSLFALALAGGMTWSCGGERVTMSQAPEAGGQAVRPLGKKAVSRDLTRAVVVVTVRQDDAPLSGATVELSRSIAGRAASYEWSGTSDERGEARVHIGSDNVSGYYRARASRDGVPVGSWSSIPINGGYELTIDLPVGGKARVTGASILTSEGLHGEIPIGVVLPLTVQLDPDGPEIEIPHGLRIKDGFELAREEIDSASKLGGASIRFIVENSRGTAEGAVEAFDKLIHQDGVPVILGPVTSTEAEAAFPIAQQNQVVAFSSTASAAGLGAIGPFIFRLGLSVDVLVPAASGVLEKRRYQSVAMMVDSTEVFSLNFDEKLTSALTEDGVAILARETFGTGDTEFSAQLTRIKALSPDAIVVSALAIDHPEILIQGRRLGIPYDVPFIVPLMGIDEVRAAGAAAEGAVTVTSWTRTASTRGNQTFVERYRARHGMDPSPLAAQSYAALHILAEAIADARSKEASAIRNALAEISGFDTILGPFSFDPDGDAVYDPIVLIVRAGELEPFE